MPPIIPTIPPPPPLPSTSNVGRPQKLFSNSSDRSKRRKFQELTESYTSIEILYAAKTKLYKSGKRAAYSIINESLSSPTRASKIKNAYMSSLSIDNTIIPYSFDEAHLVDNKLTKQQYINIRKSAKERRANLYPSYDNVLSAKKKCYPPNIQITEYSYKIKLQHLVDHTIQRIFQILDIPAVDFTMSNFEILYKWGCDGSSSQARYKQIFHTSNDINDSNIFMFSLVPLPLRCTKVDHPSTIVLWKNPCPSSTRYCRPIKFEFKKETIESTLEEVNAVEKEIKLLILTSVFKNNIEFQVWSTLMFTMIDGKVSFINLY